MTTSSPLPLKKVWHLLYHPREVWPLFRAYLGFGRLRRLDPIDDAESLIHFLDSRASFVSQTSLYGYLRTRAGQRYPDLFENRSFVIAINAAKWQIWLACLSDLAVYAGGRLVAADPAAAAKISVLMTDAVDRILDRTGVPADATADFLPAAAAVRERIAACNWAAIGDDDSAFTESPPALVKWAPIVDQLKALDEPIVLNSVRFRWQEIRRDLRQVLRPADLLRA